MMIYRALLVLLLFAAASSVSAADWFYNVAPKMGRIEQWSDGTIYWSISSNGSAVTLSGTSTSCLVTQIHLIPPVGREKEWLGMLLSATMAGKTAHVFGDCITSNTRIDATRLVIEY
jgi:hypothetical protein